MNNTILYASLKNFLIDFFPDVQLEVNFSDIIPTKRLWRADFCIPTQKIIIEVNGGNFSNGRHTRGLSYQKDLEKLNFASLNGWYLIQYTYPMLEKFHFVDLKKLSNIEKYKKANSIKNLLNQNLELCGKVKRKGKFEIDLSKKIFFFSNENGLISLYDINEFCKLL